MNIKSILFNFARVLSKILMASNRYGLALPLLVVAAVIITRVAPHPYNFTPLGAVAVFSGSRMGSLLKALAFTLFTLLVSDVAVMATVQRGFGPLSDYLFSFTAAGVYLSFALLVALGYLNSLRFKLPFVALALLSSLLFYCVTNFFVWLSPTSGYPPTLTGLASALYAGIPFYRGEFWGSFFFNQIFGDLFYFSIVFGLEYILVRRWQMA
ncbi:MAG: hypothetical protein N2110_02315 [Flavobacteriales bacterium]|nr:hypothetical protein [Flavobacteriales bacterium]MCX7767844.1 hypothetical protein [Flavobacteriales bacterium]MDW8410658.1 DUF6580 family putative transport protein [Flavobacteriales bacterium]